MKPVFDALAGHARTRPDATAFSDGQRHLTWAGLADAVTAAADGVPWAVLSAGVDHETFIEQVAIAMAQIVASNHLHHNVSPGRIGNISLN